MSRAARAALIVLFFIVAGAGVLCAETVLVAVRETVDGNPSAPPLPSVDGVDAGLFAAGHVVFDAGSQDATVEAAREGGAGWLLQITVAYTQTKLDDNAVRVAGAASFTLVNTETGARSLSDKVTVTNAGREKDVDRTALGREIGKLISQKVMKALPTPSL